jgi:hypothetical protein
LIIPQKTSIPVSQLVIEQRLPGTVKIHKNYDYKNLRSPDKIMTLKNDSQP